MPRFKSANILASGAFCAIVYGMDFFELEAAEELAKTLHFARAASKINLSPSALSRLISRLESECGMALFERNNRDVSLTAAGREFVRFAENCISLREELFQSFSGFDAISGTLNVYASVTACYSILPAFVKRLSEEYSGIHLRVQTGDPALAAESVRNGAADIAVAAIPDEGLSGLKSTSVFKSPLVFAAAMGGPYETVQGSPQDIVSSVPLILPKTGLARSRFDSWVQSRNVRPVIAAETEGNEAIMAMARLGIGIGLVPEIVLQNGPYKSGFACHSAGNALGFYNIGFIQKSQISGGENARKIRQAVDEILSSLFGAKP